MLLKRRKLQDFHEMPGVGHLYYYDCDEPQGYWFFKAYTSAFEKYAKKGDELDALEASFKLKAKQSMKA